MTQNRQLLRFTLILFAIGLWLGNSSLLSAETPAKFAGTYRIAEWESMEESHLYHFFYLHHSGEFLLAGEWPKRESSRAVGTWKVDGSHLSLSGTIEVKTNKGEWTVPYQRTFKVEISDKGIALAPLPRKNRFGILGWPNRFVFYRTTPVPNLPATDIPADEKNILLMIRELQGQLK